MRTPAIASLILPLLMAGIAGANEESDLSLGQVGSNLPTVIVESQRLSGPDVSTTGAAVYSVGAEDIENLPTGNQTPITDVLAQMPSIRDGIGVLLVMGGVAVHKPMELETVAQHTDIAAT